VRGTSQVQLRRGGAEVRRGQGYRRENFALRILHCRRGTATFDASQTSSYEVDQ
jgi:hypothetical protein